jgi:hypothetical protein
MEALIQARHNLVQREYARPRSRQLDGQRDAVQARTDVHHHIAIALGHPEFSPDCSSTFGEKTHGLILSQRWHSPCELAGDVQGLATRRQDVERRTGAQQVRGEFGAGADQVLAVVQDEQDTLVAQGIDQDVEGGPAGGDQAKRSAYRVRHQQGVRDRREFDAPHTVRK